ncbi:hypothetical protein [Algibacter sp. L4_22]|uniref:hypothetical protein n=1 Tax=Algibacter sp. L4_22 TaxID=2942477 RepID=UPI00201B76A4|nr:hypothetical protein [Algibacter sp. L4_22]MCL5129082.1 hypothetical protein [Algibacter sp. L4_22]
MKTRFLTTIFACLFIASAFSQTELDNYKYIIVSKKFDFLKSANQYQLNDLSKFLLNKYGFQALIEGDAYPEDLSRNRCLALDADVQKEPGMFKTKLKVELTNCNDKIVYTSKIGESREKEYKKSYTEAIRDAFSSFETLGYKYMPKAGALSASEPNVTVTPATSNEIEKLKEEIKTLKEEKVVEVVETKEVLVETPIAITEQVAITEVSASGVLYAQAIKNGFQLVDSSPKVLYRMYNTQLSDVFLVENKSAIIFKKDNKWFIEHHENGTLKLNLLNIKF